MLFTECTRKGDIFRAHPRYHDNKAWNDWAFVQYADGSLIAVHIFGFVEIKSIRTPIAVNETHADHPGLYCICEMLEQDLRDKPLRSDENNFKAHTASHLFFWARKWLDSHLPLSSGPPVRKKQRSNVANEDMPRLGLFDVDCIFSTCVAIPDTYPDEYHGYLFLQTRDRWPDIFVEVMKEWDANAEDVDVAIKDDVTDYVENDFQLFDSCHPDIGHGESSSDSDSISD